MTFNKYTLHAAVPTSKVQLLQSPHGFIAVIDSSKYLVKENGVKTTMAASFPDIKLFETIGTFKIYNSTSMFVVNTSNVVYKCTFGTDIATAVWSSVGSLPTSNISNYYVDDTYFYCFDTSTKLVYKAPIGDNPLVFTSSAIYGDYTPYMDTVGTPTDVYLDYFMTPGSEKLAYVSGVNKIDGNIVLKDVISMVPCISPNNLGSSIVQTFFKDSNTNQSIGSFTPSSNSDITFNFGVGRFLFIKNNGEILFSDYLNNKLKSWKLIVGISKINAHKVNNNVYFMINLSSGSTYLYMFDLKTESLTLEDSSLLSTYNMSLDTARCSKVMSYNNYIAYVTLNTGKTAVEINISTTTVDTNVRDYKISKATRSNNFQVNTDLYPSLNSTQLYTITSSIFLKGYAYTLMVAYMLLHPTRFTTNSTYIMTDVAGLHEISINLNQTTGEVYSLGGVIPDGENNIDSISLYYAMHFITDISSIITNLDANGFISSGNLSYTQANNIKVMIDDLTSFYEYIKEIASYTEKTVKLTYFDHVTGTTKEWGSVNVRLSEIN